MKIGIIGAGINGSYLAYRLRKDNDVVVIDKKAGFGNKPCSGLISERIWDFIPKKDNLVIHAIKEARIHFLRKTVSLIFKPKMLVFDRQKLDEYVGGLAKQSGAKFVFGENISDISVGDKTVSVNDKWTFHKLIGCDGANSVVRQKLTNKEQKFRLGIYFYEKKECFDDWVDTWPLKDGFAWRIPRGDSIEWGVIVPQKLAKREFDKLVERNNLKPEKIYSHIIPDDISIADPKGSVNTIYSSPSARNITICGDAAGLVKPWSGGGVIWGMTGADLLIENFGDFGKYERSIKKKFNNKVNLNKIGRNVLMFPTLEYFIPSKIQFDADWGIL
jgi:digeranylgeranylglycerophospholipid reductase